MNKLKKFGIELARQKGLFKGGKKKQIPKSLYLPLKERYLNRQITKTEFAKQLNVSRPTLNNILNNEKDYVI